MVVCAAATLGDSANRGDDDTCGACRHACGLVAATERSKEVTASTPVVSTGGRPALNSSNNVMADTSSEDKCENVGNGGA